MILKLKRACGIVFNWLCWIFLFSGIWYYDNTMVANMTMIAGFLKTILFVSLTISVVIGCVCLGRLGRECSKSIDSDVRDQIYVEIKKIQSTPFNTFNYYLQSGLSMLYLGLHVIYSDIGYLFFVVFGCFVMNIMWHRLLKLLSKSEEDKKLTENTQ